MTETGVLVNRKGNHLGYSAQSVRARTRETKGAGSRKAGLAMEFKLALASEDHWQKVMRRSRSPWYELQVQELHQGIAA